MSILKFAKKYSKRNVLDKKAKTDKVADKSKNVTATKKKKGKTTSRKVLKGQAINLDLQPLVTEKGVLLQEQGFVLFRVPTKTTKGQVRQAVKARYKVNPISIRSLRVAPKKRRRGATTGKTTGWKKMYVKVEDVQKIVTGP